MKILQEFKAFAMRGNVIDMAVGIIIGAAFGKIISSLVSDILMPPIGLLIGGINFTDIKVIMKDAVTDPATGKVLKEAVAFKIGNFIQTLIDFAIIAFSIFMIVKGINQMSRNKPAEPAPPAEPSKQEVLLGEIRDILKSR
jgi:large conductance mechanosensitive channel